MKNKSVFGTMAIGIVGGIVIGFTFAVFFLLNFERYAVHWVALGFLLLSQVVLFGGLIGIRSAGENFSKLFLRAGIGTTLFIYAGITLISVLFAGLLRDNVNIFIIIQLAIVSIFLIVSVIMLLVARRVEITNEKDASNVGVTEPKRGGF